MIWYDTIFDRSYISYDLSCLIWHMIWYIKCDMIYDMIYDILVISFDIPYDMICHIIGYIKWYDMKYLIYHMVYYMICSISYTISRGVHPRWDHDACSPPVSDFPPFFEKFSDSQENFQHFYFLEFPSYFHCFSTFPPVSRKLLFPPYFNNIPPSSAQVHLLFTYFTCISFPPTFTLMHLCINRCTYWPPWPYHIIYHIMYHIIYHIICHIWYMI